MKTETLNPFYRMIIVIGVFVIIGAPLILYSEFGTDAIQISSVVVSGLLSISLVALYYQQYGILKKQTQLQNREYESSLTQRGKVVANDNSIIIELKNKGRGKAKNIFLKSQITSDTDDLDIGFGRQRMSNAHKGTTELEPRSDFEEFRCESRFRVLSSENPERSYSFKYISRRLSSRGLDSCRIRLIIEVQDESLIEGQFAQTEEIAHQKIIFNEPETVELPNDEGDMEEKKQFPATTIEEGLESAYSANEDICSYEFAKTMR
jgi:hypothetical protein